MLRRVERAARLVGVGRGLVVLVELLLVVDVVVGYLSG